MPCLCRQLLLDLCHGRTEVPIPQREVRFSVESFLSGFCFESASPLGGCPIFQECYASSVTLGLPLTWWYPGDFLILPNKTVLVGRDEARNDVAFEDPVVSRCQLEIFSIIVDEDYKHPPLVFVRDRGSSNGTCVNGQVIGTRSKLSLARLLDSGDTITIGPYPHLTFVYTQMLYVQSSYFLSHVQRQEVKV